MFTITLTRQQLYELYDEGPEATIHLIESLLEELSDQEQILGERQQRVIDAQYERNERQAARLKRVKEALWRQQSLNLRLTRRLQELQAELERRDEQAREPRRDSHNSSLPPALDLPGVKAHNAVRRTHSLRRRTGRSVGGQPRHRGSTLPRVERPDRVVTHRPQHCRRSAAARSDGAVTAVERRQVFGLPPVRLEVTEHRAEMRRCAACGERTKAQFPRQVRAPVQYGGGVRARATYLHKYQLLPLARTGEAMRELFGCSLSPGTLHTTQERCSTKLVGAEARIRAALRGAPVIGADETGLRVAGAGGWIHVVRTDRLTHYGYDARRGRAATDALGILPAFEGTCVRDGWYAYDEYRRCRHSLCNAHLLRELLRRGGERRDEGVGGPLKELLLEMKREAEREGAHLPAPAGRVEELTARYNRLSSGFLCALRRLRGVLCVEMTAR